MTGDSSTDLDRTIIEASALLVTLLFIVAQVGEAWKYIGFMQWLSVIGFFFIGAMIVSAFSMWHEHGESVARSLHTSGFLLFFTGLLFVAVTSLLWSGPAGRETIPIFFGYAIVAGVAMAYSEKRRLKKLKEPRIV